MTDNRLFSAGAVLAGAGVVFGAFGAHALRDSLSPVELGWWQTAVQYQMWHALALIVIALAPWPRGRLPGAMIGGGVLIFAATLYAMALGAPHWLGAITPIGGSLMILGWLVLAVQAWRYRA